MSKRKPGRLTLGVCVATLAGATLLLFGGAGCGGVGGGGEAVRPQGQSASGSAGGAPGAGGAKTAAASNQAKEEIHGGPTPDKLKEIQEWKRTHPGAYTRY